MATRVVTVFDKTIKVKAALREAAQAAIAKACFDTEAAAKQNVTAQNAVDTGAMRASIYSAAPRRASGYSRAASAARTAAANPGRHSGRPHKVNIFPEIVALHGLEGIVTCGVDYGANVEQGRMDGKVPARPFMEPAFMKVGAEFVEYAERKLDAEVLE